MIWLVSGAALLLLVLWTLRAFERASVTSIRVMFQWILVLGGILLTVLLFLSGRGFPALSGLVLAGPALWRHFRPTTAPPPPIPPASGGRMTRNEAFDVLGLQPDAPEEAVRAAHRRLMRSAHPDHGGSDWLASRINQARDVLLG